MSDAAPCRRQVRSNRRRSGCGYVRSLKTRKPVSTPCRMPFSSDHRRCAHGRRTTIRRLEKRDARVFRQRMTVGHSQASRCQSRRRRCGACVQPLEVRNEGYRAVAVPLRVKTAVRRPGAKEGGREEEEKRSGIAARSTGRLRSNENWTLTWTGCPCRSSMSGVATACVGWIEQSSCTELMSSILYRTV